MASLGTLAAIAKQRPPFMSLVVEAFESLHGIYVYIYIYSFIHISSLLQFYRILAISYFDKYGIFLANLPSSLSKSQVSSVRKNLKVIFKIILVNKLVGNTLIICLQILSVLLLAASDESA